MLVKTYCAAINGLEVTTVTVEVSVESGQNFYLSGLGDESVRESQGRIRTSFMYSGYKYPNKNITINLAPADLRKEGTVFDLPIAIGILAANEDMPATSLSNYLLIGELGLDGSLQPVRGALPIAIKARSEGYKGMILPRENAREAAVVNRLEIYGMDNLTEVVKFLSGQSDAQPLEYDTRKVFKEQQARCDLDFADVKGQESVKRAMEVAAAGGHNMIMIGPPGSGKSMMAKRLPSILPPLSLSESLETTQIHSIAGKLKSDRDANANGNENVYGGASLITQRPFRSPHHTISQVALVGGGSKAVPGEISLAHNGVLFCDELPEFSKSTLEVLRQPLEDRTITISRAKYTIEYPCSFMFVASANPCPCGYYGDPTHHCVCTPNQIQRYMNKISGPLMDRIDIQVDIVAVPFTDLSKAERGEPSENIRQRVMKARQIQTERFKNDKSVHCNAQMNDKMLHQYCVLDEQTLTLLQNAMAKMNLSARAYSRILKVARTIADLEGSENIQMPHIAEAIGYRQLDRGDWAER